MKFDVLARLAPPALTRVCRRSFLMVMICGVAGSSAVLIRNTSALAPCPGVLRFPSDEYVVLSGTLEARAGATTDDCWFAPAPLSETDSYTVDVQGDITSNCSAFASDSIDTTGVDTGILSDQSASARGQVTFYGTGASDEDIVGEGSLGTYISAAFHYAADFNVWASDSSCNTPNFPGAEGELETYPDLLTVEIPFSVVETARFDADATLTVGGVCVESDVTGVWKIEEVGGGYTRTGTVSVNGAGTDAGSWGSIIGLGDYIFTATLDDFTEAEICLTSCPDSDSAICTHTVDLEIDLEFTELISCPWCP